MKSIIDFINEDSISKNEVGTLTRMKRSYNPNSPGNYGVFIIKLTKDWQKKKAEEEQLYYKGNLVCKYFGYTTRTYCDNWIKNINEITNAKTEYKTINKKDIEHK